MKSNTQQKSNTQVFKAGPAHKPTNSKTQLLKFSITRGTSRIRPKSNPNQTIGKRGKPEKKRI